MSKKKKDQLITEKVYSPIDDKQIGKGLVIDDSRMSNLFNSPIWKRCYHSEDYPQCLSEHTHMFVYTIRFDGLRPIQFSGVKKIQ